MIEGFEMVNNFLALVEWVPGVDPGSPLPGGRAAVDPGLGSFAGRGVDPGSPLSDERKRYLERFTWGIPACPYNRGNIAFIIEGHRDARNIMRFTTYWEGVEYRSGPASFAEFEERFENWRQWARDHTWAKLTAH